MPFFNSLSPAQRRVLGWSALSLAALLLLWLLAPVLSPFVAATVLAYVLAPLVDRLARRLPRVLAVILVELLVLLVAASLLLLLVPIVTKELPLLREQLPLLAGKLNDGLAPWLQRLGVPIAFDMPTIKAFVLEHFGDQAGNWLTTLLGSVRIGGSVLLALGRQSGADPGGAVLPAARLAADDAAPVEPGAAQRQGARRRVPGRVRPTAWALPARPVAG
jgi:predicted PurR-regulated permease PerM